MNSVYEDLKWKAEYLQSRGYYTNMSIIQLIEMIQKSGETPYPWKHDANTKLVDSENHDPKG